MINCGLNKKEMEAIKSVFLSHPKVESVKIFGSRAKGNYRKNSDIDLVIIGDVDQLEAERISNELDDLPLPYLFDVKTLNQINSPELLDHIKRVGISLTAPKPLSR